METKKPSYLQLFSKGRTTLSVAILLSVSLVALDVLIVNTVLPTILRELGGLSLFAWAIGAYSLGSFITIPIFSTLVPKIGGRRSFAMATTTFLIGAVVAALAPSMHWIVLGRLIQGIGAGGFFSIPFGLVNLHYPPELQPRAIGLISAVWGFAAVGGPLLGATILKFAAWPWVFWFNLPVGGIILILGLMALRKEGPPPDPRAKLNIPGPLLFALSTALFLECLVTPFPWNLIFGVATVACILFFLKHEARHPTPIIPRDAWSFSKPLGVAFLGMALACAAFGGSETFLPLMLQGIWGATPLEAGLILTVGSVSWSFTSVFIARYADYPKRLTQIGTTMITLGVLILFVTVFFQGPIYFIYIGWFIAGMGIGQVVPTYNTLSIDVAKNYPSGVAPGALLLALTWGFAVGAPAVGVVAQYGFNEGFVPSRIGLGALSLKSLDALKLGGSFALLCSVGLALLAIFLGRRMPAHRMGGKNKED